MTRRFPARDARVCTAAALIGFFWQVPGYAASGDQLAVSSRALTLRAGPDRTSAVRAWLKQGEVLVEVERQGLWIKVDTDRKPPKNAGWVHSRYVSLAKGGASSAPQAESEPTPPKADPQQAETQDAETQDAERQDAETGPAVAQQSETPQAETPKHQAQDPTTAQTESATESGAAATPEAPESTSAPAATETQTVAAAAPPQAAAAPAPDPAKTRATARKRFEDFYREYQQVTARYRSLTGKDLFSSAVDKGSGQLVLTATDFWFTGTDKDRENDVATVMKLWKKSQESDSVLIVVVDERGLEQMRMFEKLD